MFRQTVTRSIEAFFFLILFVAAYTAQGQPFDFAHARAQMLSLEGEAQFHVGDDPDGKLGWADPGFDDSGWQSLRTDLPWGAQDYAGLSGFAWYRFKVILPSSSEPLGILIPRLRTSYEVFVDGKSVGQFGGLPPQGRYIIGANQIFAIPAGSFSGQHLVTIAIRVWNMEWLARLGGGLEGAPTIGSIDALNALKTRDDRQRSWTLTAGNALMLMNLVAAFAGFFLFWMRPSDREFLWFALYELLTGAQHLVGDWANFYPADWATGWVLDDCLASSSWLFFLLFVFRILNGRRNWLFWAAVGTPLATTTGALIALAGSVSWDLWRIFSVLCLIPYFACILLLLFHRARQGVADARLMLAPVALCYCTWFGTLVLGLLNVHGQAWVRRDFGWLFQLSVWPFPFSFLDIADMLMLLAVLAVLPLRFARSRRDEERFSAELESARAVQQVLIPAEIPTVPGYKIECVYRPAGHVGGDFFQIIPTAQGELLIAIGDVSGKGMPAAMTVSLLVGTLRTLAHYTSSPAEILDAMNRRMLSRSQGGFTTCLVVRAAPDATMTIANAGHLSPYLDGKEVATMNGLPLGLAEQSTYVESTFKLSPGAQVTFMTDGVVEARNRAGELLGFERTAAMSTENAGAIMQAAQAFGQEDDITVLTLARAS